MNYWLNPARRDASSLQPIEPLIHPTVGNFYVHLWKWRIEKLLVVWDTFKYLDDDDDGLHHCCNILETRTIIANTNVRAPFPVLRPEVFDRTSFCCRTAHHETYRGPHQGNWEVIARLPYARATMHRADRRRQCTRAQLRGLDSFSQKNRE
mmetsp:Transcript_11266/g.16467  ORF Transcript_11266/g.16467 Transcript_11266/m.16467 type:complete len:151 (+) Transcript_11266:711-1163(+)